jgi:hypothetical protein
MTCLQAKDLIELGKLIEKAIEDPEARERLQNDPNGYLSEAVIIPAGHKINIVVEPDLNETIIVLPSKKDLDEIKQQMTTEDPAFAFPQEYKDLDPAAEPQRALLLRLGDLCLSRCRFYD